MLCLGLVRRSSLSGGKPVGRAFVLSHPTPIPEDTNEDAAIISAIYRCVNLRIEKPCFDCGTGCLPGAFVKILEGDEKCAVVATKIGNEPVIEECASITIKFVRRDKVKLEFKGSTPPGILDVLD